MKNRKLTKSILAVIAIAAFVMPSVVLASDAGTTSVEQLSKLYPGKVYSPYAQRSFPSKIYW